MKKNLFLLFVIYFFVLQAFIIGSIRKESNFFILGLINFGIIIIISVIHSYFEKTDKKIDGEESISSKKETVLPEKTHKSKKTNIKNKLFFISLLISIIAFFLLKGYILSNKIIIATSIGFLIFMFLFYISKGYKHNRFLKTRGSRIYLIIFVIGIIVSGFDATIPEFREETAVGCIINIVSNGGKYIPNTSYTKQENYKSEELIFPKDNQTQEEIIIETGYVIQESSSTNEQEELNNTYNNLQSNITIIQAIKHLIDKNQIPLDNKQNVRFTYMSYQDSDYPYFKTAFNKKMIGTNTDPNKEIICQTYIVMKGLAQGRNVSTSTDILQAYRDKAVQLSELNGCQKNRYVTNKNL